MSAKPSGNNNPLIKKQHAPTTQFNEQRQFSIIAYKSHLVVEHVCMCLFTCSHQFRDEEVLPEHLGEADGTGRVYSVPLQVQHLDVRVRLQRRTDLCDLTET